MVTVTQAKWACVQCWYYSEYFMLNQCLVSKARDHCMHVFLVCKHNTIHNSQPPCHLTTCNNWYPNCNILSWWRCHDHATIEWAPFIQPVASVPHLNAGRHDVAILIPAAPANLYHTVILLSQSLMMAEYFSIIFFSFSHVYTMRIPIQICRWYFI